MGCGHTKISLLPRKNHAANDENSDGEEDCKETAQTIKLDEDPEDPLKKSVKVKPLGGGPLLAQSEISSSQQNFFKMLDEKIENGPDYDSGSETELALERARLQELLQYWEAASARSTPSRRTRHSPSPRRAPGCMQCGQSEKNMKKSPCLGGWYHHQPSPAPGGRAPRAAYSAPVGAFAYQMASPVHHANSHKSLKCCNSSGEVDCYRHQVSARQMVPQMVVPQMAPQMAQQMVPQMVVPQVYAQAAYSPRTNHYQTSVSVVVPPGGSPHHPQRHYPSAMV